MRLIDADTLHYHKVWIEKDQKFAIVVFAKEIDHAHAVDAEPVVRGHWVAKQTMARTPFARNHYCSQCEFETDFCTNYCSNCGAKMDEVSE